MFKFNLSINSEKVRIEEKVRLGNIKIAGNNELLKSSEGRQRAISNLMMDAVVTIDDQGIMQDFNPAAEKIFGYGAGDVIGKNLNILMPTHISEAHDGYLQHYHETRIPHVIASNQ